MNIGIKFLKIKFWLYQKNIKITQYYKYDFKNYIEKN